MGLKTFWWLREKADTMAGHDLVPDVIAEAGKQAARGFQP